MCHTAPGLCLPLWGWMLTVSTVPVNVACCPCIGMMLKVLFQCSIPSFSKLAPEHFLLSMMFASARIPYRTDVSTVMKCILMEQSGKRLWRGCWNSPNRTSRGFVPTSSKWRWEMSTAAFTHAKGAHIATTWHTLRASVRGQSIQTSSLHVRHFMH